jgi:hypothetical protein
MLQGSPAPLQQPKPYTLPKGTQSSKELWRASSLPPLHRKEEPTTSYSVEEAKRLNVLIQTDAMLDNPKFDPGHAAAAAGKTAAVISTLVGLPIVSLLVKIHETKPWLTFTHLPGLDKKRSAYPKYTGDVPHLLARVAYGTGALAALNGVVFAPLVAYIMVSDVRTRLMNIRRTLKQEYTDYKPDFVDHHFSHIKQVKNPTAEFNDVRKKLTDPTTATQNAYHIAIMVKLLTLGSKVAALVGLGFGIQFYKHFEKFKYARDAYQKTSKHADYYFPIYKHMRRSQSPEGEIISSRPPLPNVQHFFNMKYSQGLFKAAVARPTLANRIHFGLEWLRYSRALHGLKEFGSHFNNPLLLACFIASPAMVGLGMIPYFRDAVGVEPYNPAMPDGTHWQQYRHGVKVVLKREPIEAEPQRNTRTGA